MSEKTHEATDHHVRKARDKGQVAVSEDLLHSAVCIGVFETCAALIARFGGYWLDYLADFVGQAARLDAGIGWDVGNIALWLMLSLLLSILVGAAAVSLNLALRWMQTGGPVVVEEPFSFKAEKFNPVKIFQDMFSRKTVTKLLGNLGKTAVVAVMAWFAVRGVFEATANGMGTELGGLLVVVATHVMLFLRRTLIAMLAVSLVDVWVQRRQLMHDLRMSHEEVKEEHKSTDGNPEVKQHVKKVGHEMLNETPARKGDPLQGANALVVNPTHLAVGLRFIEAEKRPPMLCVKAEDDRALALIDEAHAAGIPVVRHLVLARTLYKERVGAAVPRQTYRLVAALYRALQGLDAGGSAREEALAEEAVAAVPAKQNADGAVGV